MLLLTMFSEEVELEGGLDFFIYKSYPNEPFDPISNYSGATYPSFDDFIDLLN